MAAVGWAGNKVHSYCDQLFWPQCGVKVIIPLPVKVLMPGARRYRLESFPIGQFVRISTSSSTTTSPRYTQWIYGAAKCIQRCSASVIPQGMLMPGNFARLCALKRSDNMRFLRSFDLCPRCRMKCASAEDRHGAHRGFSNHMTNGEEQYNHP